jgi:hypothetical protein
VNYLASEFQFLKRVILLRDTSIVENILVVIGKEMKRGLFTLRENPSAQTLEKPKSTKFWRSSV